MDRFDLEQQILDCWKITDDIAMEELVQESTDKWHKENILRD